MCPRGSCARVIKPRNVIAFRNKAAPTSFWVRRFVIFHDVCVTSSACVPWLAQLLGDCGFF